MGFFHSRDCKTYDRFLCKLSGYNRKCHLEAGYFRAGRLLGRTSRQDFSG